MSSTTSAAATTTSAIASSAILDFISTWTWRLGGFSLSLVLILGAALYAKQESLLYLPVIQGVPRHNRENPRGYRQPGDRGLEHWFNVQIPTSDGIFIHAWYIIHPVSLAANGSKKVPTVIFFHGNAGNIGLRLPNAWQMMQTLQCHVLLVEYRGYGDSDDRLPPNEIGLQRDAQAVYDWIAQELKIKTTTTTSATSVAKVKPMSDQLASAPGGVASFFDQQQLFVFGRSLGGAVAFSLATFLEKNNDKNNYPPLAGLIVENTFLSISSMVDKIFPFLTPIKPYVLRMDWNNEARAAQLIKTPVLYLAGARDELVPHQHMQTLYQTSMAVAGNTMAVLHVIDNGTHNESWYQGGKDYWNAVKRFMTKAVTRNQQTKTSEVTVTAATAKMDMFGGKDSHAIPTMSSKFVDMAQHAFTSNNNNKATEKDSKKSS